MKTISILLMISLLLVSSCEREQDNEKVYTEVTTAEILADLKNAYERDSDSALICVLHDWNDKVPAKNISSLSDDTEKAIYKIFLAFYNPFDIDKYGQHEWGNSMYEGYDYVIIQNELFYYKGNGETDYEDRDSITDFRPAVNIDGKTTLYLTPNYNEALLYFLNPEYNPSENTMFEEISEEGWDHWEFITTTLAILPGHWGGYWHIETHPYISFLSIDNDLHEAKLEFRIGYMFGEAQFENKITGWEMTSSSITGIEK